VVGERDTVKDFVNVPIHHGLHGRRYPRCLDRRMHGTHHEIDPRDVPDDKHCIIHVLDGVPSTLSHGFVQDRKGSWDGTGKFLIFARKPVSFSQTLAD